MHTQIGYMIKLGLIIDEANRFDTSSRNRRAR